MACHRFEFEGVIKLSEGQEPSFGGDGGAIELQADLGVELEVERGLFAIYRK